MLSCYFSIIELFSLKYGATRCYGYINSFYRKLPYNNIIVFVWFFSIFDWLLSPFPWNMEPLDAIGTSTSFYRKLYYKNIIVFVWFFSILDWNFFLISFHLFLTFDTYGCCYLCFPYSLRKSFTEKRRLINY